MWDWLKNAAGNMLQAGVEYLEHRDFILSLFDIPHEQAYWTLKQKVDSMDEATVQRFYSNIRLMIQEAEQTVQQAVAQSSWGSTFEDQMAQLMANASAGSPPNQAVQQAQMVLNGLVATAQHVQLFYQQRGAQLPGTAGPPAVQPGMPPTPFQPPTFPPPAPAVQPMDDMQKLQRYQQLQQRYAIATPNIMPGKASLAVVEEFQDIYAGYEALLKAGLPKFEFYTLPNVQSNMADALDMIARTWDSLRDEEKAIAYYERAAQTYEQAGLPGKAADSRANIAKIQTSRTGSIDHELLRVQAELAKATPGTLPYIKKVVEIGELHMKAGDDFAAQAEFKKALVLLEEIGYPEPQAKINKELLENAVAASYAGQPEKLQEVETLTLVKGLYQNIYFYLMDINLALEDLDEMEVWLKKHEQLGEDDLTDEDIAQILGQMQAKAGGGE